MAAGYENIFLTLGSQSFGERTGIAIDAVRYAHRHPTGGGVVPGASVV